MADRNCEYIGGVIYWTAYLNMANPEHLDILSRGVTVWNKWRQKDPDTRPDLSSTRLSRRNLRGANLRGCSLAEGHLNKADFEEREFESGQPEWGGAERSTAHFRNTCGSDVGWCEPSRGRFR